jgi:anti-sigma factor RsiW
MHNELFPLLNAYLDGELRGKRLREMESHLDDCATCRAELTELRRVSGLLRTASAPEFPPAERFASNLTLRLPRHRAPARPQGRFSVAGWLVPASLLGLWVFTRTVFSLTNLVRMMNIGGWIGQAAPWLNDGPSQTAWFAVTFNMFRAQMNSGERSTLSLVNQFNIFGVDLLQGLIWQAGLLLLCLAWVAIWQARSQMGLNRISNQQ